MTQHDTQCRVLGYQSFFVFQSSFSGTQGTQSQVRAACPANELLSPLSSTSSAKVRVVGPEDSTLDPKIQTGIRTELNFWRQRTGGTARGKAFDTAKVRCLDLRLQGRQKE